MAITAKLVKELREQTGAGMMECKKALVETEGDLKKAAEYLQIKGIAKAAKKADRVAAEGTIGAVLAADGKSGAMLEVNCETDFVARNEEFGGLVAGLTEHVLSSGVTDAAALLETDFNGQTVDEYRKSKIASTGENITLRRAGILALAGEGAVNFYRHNGGAIGVLVGINAGSSVEGNAAVAELARDIAMHVAAENPEVTDSSELAEEIVADKTRIEVEKAMESGKPEEIAKKMVIGRINKWKKEISLLDQKFVKNPDLSVAEHVAAIGKEQGLELSVAGFQRFVCGEGIEKVESNLADEVAALAK